MSFTEIPHYLFSLTSWLSEALSSPPSACRCGNRLPGPDVGERAAPSSSPPPPSNEENAALVGLGGLTGDTVDKPSMLFGTRYMMHFSSSFPFLYPSCLAHASRLHAMN